MRTRPSTIEYSEWTRRWVKVGEVIPSFYRERTRHGDCRTASRRLRGAFTNQKKAGLTAGFLMIYARRFDLRARIQPFLRRRRKPRPAAARPISDSVVGSGTVLMLTSLTVSVSPATLALRKPMLLTELIDAPLALKSAP